MCGMIEISRWSRTSHGAAIHRRWVLRHTIFARYLLPIFAIPFFAFYTSGRAVWDNECIGALYADGAPPRGERESVAAGLCSTVPSHQELEERVCAIRSKVND